MKTVNLVHVTCIECRPHPLGHAECVACGEVAPVCCDSGGDDYGNHVDPYCERCCGPHSKRMAGIGGYERMDCDR